MAMKTFSDQKGETMCQAQISHVFENICKMMITICHELHEREGINFIFTLLGEA
jgi:hypothetical protein